MIGLLSATNPAFLEEIMGCYDTLRFACPSCGEITSVQSKAGERTMEYFTLKDAPLNVLVDIHMDGEAGELFCEKCEVQLNIRIKFFAEVVVDDGDDFTKKIMRTV
jgi:transcription elongation factor Elf1